MQEKEIVFAGEKKNSPAHKLSDMQICNESGKIENKFANKQNSKSENNISIQQQTNNDLNTSIQQQNRRTQSHINISLRF